MSELEELAEAAQTTSYRPSRVIGNKAIGYRRQLVRVHWADGIWLGVQIWIGFFLASLALGLLLLFLQVLGILVIFGAGRAVGH